MTTTSRAERKKAKTRFAIIYVVSLMLLFVIMSAFWKKFGGMQASVEPSQAAEKEAYFIQLDTLLHRKMEQLDDLYTGYVRARKGGSEEGSNALFSARADLGKTLDSIDQQAAFLNEGPKKKAMTFAASLFRKAVEDRDELMNGVLVLPKNAAAVTASVMVDSANLVEIANLKRQIGEREAEIAALRNNPSPGTSNNNAALAQLQTVVTEKDRQIALLQTQLKQRPAVGNSNATVTQLQ
ncbi:MAG TPA: hypothetical protein VM871_06185, partial [Flavisolibacter sp.]|nr:hypothetical protein [Flavisolibacter sp.]